MTLLLFITALTLSGIAAWYAIAGLVAIFAALPLPIMIMGGALEAAKLVVASWLYRNYKTIPFFMKTYFTMALVVLMFLTSMGIFGFLSKAHIEQTASTADNTVVIQRIDTNIKRQQKRITDADKQIRILDDAIERYNELGAVTKGVKARADQKPERDALAVEIKEAEAEMAKLEDEKLELTKQQVQAEAEVGPIKYIAALIYGDDINKTLLEEAVRIVILMIVFVFDPLAVLMVMAANREMMKNKKEDKDELVQSQSEQEQEETQTTSSATQKVEVNNAVAQSVSPTAVDTPTKENIEEKEDEFWRLSELPTQTEGGQTTQTSEEKPKTSSTTEEEVSAKVEDEETLNKTEQVSQANRNVGRLLTEIESTKKSKTRSFLSKVGKVPDSEITGDEDPFK